MPERAHVTSVEALEDFRNKLVIYLSKARPTVEEVTAEVMRTRLWLENEQRVHWEGQVRRRTKVLEQAQSALFSSRVSSLREESGTEQMAVQRAKRALDEAQEKLKLLKQWSRDFGSRVEPMVKQLDKLHTMLSNDMLLAVASLAQSIKTLDAYADIAPASASSGPAQPSGAAATEGATTPSPAGPFAAEAIPASAAGAGGTP